MEFLLGVVAMPCLRCFEFELNLLWFLISEGQIFLIMKLIFN